MRPIAFAAAMIGAACVLASADVMAQSSPWCSVDASEGGENCGFATREQCAAVAGNIGWCAPNRNALAAPAEAPGQVRVDRNQGSARPTATTQAPAVQANPTQASTPATAPAQPRVVRKKQGSPAQAAATPSSAQPAPTANTAVSASPAARTAIPLPDRALLTPPAQFNCELMTASLDTTSAQQQASATAAQNDPNSDAWMRTKLDYGRQCYRHAEIIVRERLRQLQDSVGETIKAINRGGQVAANTGTSTRSRAKSSIPLPDQALLTPPAEFSCEFKTTDSATDGAALRLKLDYERQCYQHAEMIMRDRLRQLQASVSETMKTLNRGRQASPDRQRVGENNGRRKPRLLPQSEQAKPPPS